uniref:Tudor-knot domain-containing protein n=1 Tax=Takifugu rubripes TaxID=31033 RepID=A0A3B5KCU9_TAKRU
MTFQKRAGIIFEVGAQLEARERHKKWYSATIKKIDCDRERVLVHYQHWSHRHDEWFQWNSPLLRPLERVSLRRQGLTDGSESSWLHLPEFSTAS